MQNFILLMQAQHELEPIGQVGNTTTWLMTGANPRFILSGHSIPLPAGVYRLDIEALTEWDQLIEPTMFIAYGDEHVETQASRLHFGPTILGAEAYFSIPAAATRLRFGPSSSPGTLQIGKVQLVRSSKALWRARGLVMHLQSCVQTTEDFKNEIRKATRKLKRDGWRGFLRTLDYVADTASTASSKTFTQIPLRAFIKQCTAAASKARALANWSCNTARNKTRASVSIVVPVGNCKLGWFSELLESITKQTNPDFNVVIVLDGSRPELTRVAKKFGRTIPRTTIVENTHRRGLSNARNHGISIANTEFVVIINPDDILPAYLIEFFHRTVAELSVDIVYFDEALIDEPGKNVLNVVSRGVFDLRHYLSHPYIVRAVFLKKKLFERSGGFDPSSDVLQDVDLFLRCVSLAESIVHVPITGYFFRSHPDSLDSLESAGDSENVRSTIQKFIYSFYGWSDCVHDGPAVNTFEISPPLPKNGRVAIVIPTKNRASLLRACLESIAERRSTNSTPYDIFVVDHESDDAETITLLTREKALGNIDVISYRGPWNYSAINNAAIHEIDCRADYTHYCFMNNDIELRTSNWLDAMTSKFSYPDVGVVGCCLLYPDGRVQHAGVVVGMRGVANHAFQLDEPFTEPGVRASGYLGSLAATRDYSAVTGALMIVTRDLFSALGGFDEAFAVGFNDVDLCMRAGQKGFKSCYVGSVTAMHHESASRGSDPHPDDTARFCRLYIKQIRFGDEHLGIMMDWLSTNPSFTLAYRKPFRLRVNKMTCRPLTKSIEYRQSYPS
jgi:GT2 family glycosyltransferase